jgi:hypothetical protein
VNLNNYKYLTDPLQLLTNANYAGLPSASLFISDDSDWQPVLSETLVPHTKGLTCDGAAYASTGVRRCSNLASAGLGNEPVNSAVEKAADCPISTMAQ